MFTVSVVAALSYPLAGSVSVIVAEGVLPEVVKKLSSPLPPVVQYAVWAINNLVLQRIPHFLYLPFLSLVADAVFPFFLPSFSDLPEGGGGVVKGLGAFDLYAHIVRRTTDLDVLRRVCNSVTAMTRERTSL